MENDGKIKHLYKGSQTGTKYNNHSHTVIFRDFAPAIPSAVKPFSTPHAWRKVWPQSEAEMERAWHSIHEQFNLRKKGDSYSEKNGLVGQSMYDRFCFQCLPSTQTIGRLKAISETED